MIGLIVAMDPNHLIGARGTLPWRYKEDLRRFKAVTMDAALILGRKTFQSLPGLLPGRKHIVLTSQDTSGWPVQPDATAKTLKEAVEKAQAMAKDVWIAGGADVYREALHSLVPVPMMTLDITLVPEVDVTGIPEEERTYFPKSGLELFSPTATEVNLADPRLTHTRYGLDPNKVAVCDFGGFGFGRPA